MNPTHTIVPTDKKIQSIAVESPHAEVDIFELDADVQSHASSLYWNWLNLFNSDLAAHVFQHPDYVIEEVRNQSRSDTRKPYIAVYHDGSSIRSVGVLLPKDIPTKTAGGFGLNWTLRGWRLAGNRFIGDQDVAIQQKLIEAIIKFSQGQRGNFVLVEDLDRNSQLWSAISQLPQTNTRVFLPYGLQERLRVHFTGEAAEYWGKFSSKTQNTFRRKQKRIGNTRLERVTSHDQIPSFLEHAHRISLATWQTQQLGLRVLNDDLEASLFATLATLEALRCYLLYKDDIPIAFLIGNQFNGVFNYEEVGYDREFAKASPGQVLLLDVIADLQEHNPPDWLDFGGGDAEYKRIFSTDASQSGSVWLVPRSFRGNLATGYLSICRGLKNQARSVLSKAGLFTAIRQRSRR